MNMREVVSEVSISTGMTQRDVQKVLDAFFQEITYQVTDSGNRLTIRGFGVFSRRVQKARKGKLHGQEVQIPEKRCLHFRPYGGQRVAV